MRLGEVSRGQRGSENGVGERRMRAARLSRQRHADSQTDRAVKEEAIHNQRLCTMRLPAKVAAKVERAAQEIRVLLNKTVFTVEHKRPDQSQPPAPNGDGSSVLIPHS